MEQKKVLVAMSGGVDVSKIPEALALVKTLLEAL